jgi:hypothetical protein
VGTERERILLESAGSPLKTVEGSCLDSRAVTPTILSTSNKAVRRQKLNPQSSGHEEGHAIVPSRS